ncbi:hypothetical protein PVAND_015864 [Polypedilum vanderplanki]|uniref:Ionotropic receptor n=1 Tax=Polypedilum vanderplanki TaxID=319348 RepID=A0A9J6BEG3_POLVA|nr:hypothetical protein PVAND_015864 [Polypedilum vanderplanki]
MSFPNLDNKRPGYNALGVFFGVAFLGLPRKTLSRYILIIYIWFCLIIRTCWQSMMFELMTSDMRKPLPQTLDDLRELNYTIVIQDSILFTSTSVLQELLNGRESLKIITLINNNKDDDDDDREFLVYYNQSLNAETYTNFAFLVDADVFYILNNLLS